MEKERGWDGKRKRVGWKKKEGGMEKKESGMEKYDCSLRVRNRNYILSG